MRSRYCIAPSGLIDVVAGPFPRALPWALLLRPVGAYFSALKGRNTPAQGSALGWDHLKPSSPVRARQG
ncbi:MAG: hypothetical protein QME81_15375 [bacterium]|nr:hypothetical protein [bacterium]